MSISTPGVYKSSRALVLCGIPACKSFRYFKASGGSGKGLYLHLMRHLCGPRLVQSLDLHNLSGTFWGEPLVGKRHIHIAECADSPRESNQITRVLKSISGEDEQDIDRKNRSRYSGQIQALFTLALNGELDYLHDPSSALLSRLHYFSFPRDGVAQRRKIRPFVCLSCLSYRAYCVGQSRAMPA